MIHRATKRRGRLCIGAVVGGICALGAATPARGLAAPGAAAPPLTKPAPPLTKPAPPSSPEADLMRAKLSYDRGDYARAIALLRPLLYPSATLPDEAQVLLAHKLLGLSCFFEQDDSGTEQEFNALLSLKPDFTLDPLIDPVKAVAMLDSLRQRNAERLRELRSKQAQAAEQRQQEAAEQRRREEARLRAQAQRVYIERVVRKRYGPLLFVPFGAPQLVDRRRLVGGLLLGSQTLLGAASLSSWLVVRLRYPSGTFPPQEYNTARALTVTYLTTGVLFWGVVLTGLVDALVHARTVVEVRELPGPPARPSSLRLLPLLPGEAHAGIGPLPGDAVLGLSLSGALP